MKTTMLLETVFSGEFAPESFVGEAKLAAFKRDLVNDLIVASLTAYRRLREFEQLLFERFAPGRLTHEARDLTSRLFAEWECSASPLLDHARSLKKTGAMIMDFEEFDRAVGVSLARLSVSSEQTRESIEQAERREFIPAKELRDELHTRLHT